MAGSAANQFLSLFLFVAVASQWRILHCEARSLPKMWAGGQKKSFQYVDPIFEARRNSTRRALGGGCGTGNPVDDCWMCDPNWAQNRQSLADCAIGFGKDATGGKNGKIYTVTDDSDDDVINPAPGTLRYGVLQDEPLWIVFERNMNIQLQHELIMNSYKTIDGRGAEVHIAGGAGLTIQFISNIIIHGIHIHDIVQTGPAIVRSNPQHYGHRLKADGDAVNIFGSKEIWVDHCYLANSADGLVDAIEGSTALTISNCYFTHHNEVMLLGAHKQDTFDTIMQVTVAFNHFGSDLMQRIPRCRFGYFHVVNNNYPSGWGIYAIGGSEAPTILSEGNRFFAPDGNSKEVTKRVDDGGSDMGGLQNWNWISTGDMFLNGAFFTPSGELGGGSVYEKAISLTARPASDVESLTANSGPLQCGAGVTCCPLLFQKNTLFGGIVGECTIYYGGCGGSEVPGSDSTGSTASSAFLLPQSLPLCLSAAVLSAVLVQ